MIVGCPTCGAEVEFRYDDSFVRVCGHCRAAVVRTDRGADTLGRFADLVPIESALRLFAEGRYGAAGFLLIGMAQLRHAGGGVWQEWYAKLDPIRGDRSRSAAKQGSESPDGEGPPVGDGGRWAWISEAQGRLYVTLERPDVTAPPIGSLAPGARVELAGAVFTVAERGTATYVSAVGEIPYRLVPNSALQFVDLSDGRGGFATIDYGDGGEPPVVYLGHQVTPEDLGLSGGEAPEQVKPAAGARLACPSCNGSLELRAPDHTLRVACPSCGSLVSVEGGTLSIIARQAGKPKLAIALGEKGRFADGELTVIGYVGRSACIDARWWPFEEYLLYASGVGFRWLVCSDGHWSYVQPVQAGAVSVGHRARYGGVSFQRFQAAPLRVDHVLGELYWRVQAGERVRSEDFIAPPAMLSCETSGSEQNWSLATYLTPREVERAFGRGLGLPRPTGVGPHQPYPGGVGKVAALVAVAFVAAGIGKCAGAPAAEKLRQRFTVPVPGQSSRPAADPALGPAPGVAPSSGPLGGGAPASPATPLTGSDTATADAPSNVTFSDRFQLDGGRNVAFALSADVSNDWVHAVLDLVNEDTGGVVSFERSIEYYGGFDGGESWSEGSRSADQVIGPVEPGHYVLRVEAQHGGLDSVHLTVAVRQGVFRWVWFWIGLGVLAVPFAVVGLHAAGFRKRRWENSNLVPHRAGEGDDD